MFSLKLFSFILETMMTQETPTLLTAQLAMIYLLKPSRTIQNLFI